jgi:hypothetical protein
MRKFSREKVNFIVSFIGALEFQKRRWTDQWNEVALPTFR